MLSGELWKVLEQRKFFRTGALGGEMEVIRARKEGQGGALGSGGAGGGGVEPTAFRSDFALGHPCLAKQASRCGEGGPRALPRPLSPDSRLHIHS